MNAEVEERLAAGTSRLRPQDWKSGDKLWVVEIIAPFGGAEEMVKDLKAKVFATKELKFLSVGGEGATDKEHLINKTSYFGILIRKSVCISCSRWHRIYAGLYFHGPTKRRGAIFDK